MSGTSDIIAFGFGAWSAGVNKVPTLGFGIGAAIVLPIVQLTCAEINNRPSINGSFASRPSINGTFELEKC